MPDRYYQRFQFIYKNLKLKVFKNKSNALKNRQLPLLLLIVFSFYACSGSLLENHGRVETELFFSEGTNKPLFVALGGSEGGNVFTSDKFSEFREKIDEAGFVFLALEYFGGEHTSSILDRISLESVYQSIEQISNQAGIDTTRIVLFGGSRGAELVLNLASRYPQIDGVIAVAPSHVSFASMNRGRTSAWMFNGREVPYVSLSRQSERYARNGDWVRAFEIMLENESVVNESEINVEMINGPILLISAKSDEVWPSNYMANQIMEKLEVNNFSHYYEHISVEGGHSDSFDSQTILDFLQTHF